MTLKLHFRKFFETLFASEHWILIFHQLFCTFPTFLLRARVTLQWVDLVGWCCVRFTRGSSIVLPSVEVSHLVRRLKGRHLCLVFLFFLRVLQMVNNIRRKAEENNEGTRPSKNLQEPLKQPKKIDNLKKF